MPENRQVNRNVGVSNSSSPSVGNIEGNRDLLNVSIMRLKIQTNDKQNGEAVAYLSPYPDRPGEPNCIYYTRTGMCGYGSDCRFNHPLHIGQNGQYLAELPERVGEPDCVYFLKTGTCKYGSTCKYHHPRDRNGAGPVYLNILGLPIRQEEKPCPYYMRTGSCKFGVACKFHHPQPASAETVLGGPGPAAYGSTGHSIVPSSGLPFMGGPPPWSPRATYSCGPRLQGPLYMPVALSPSQGMVPTPGWSTYMGIASPVSSTSVLGDSGFDGQMHPLSRSVAHLPERPDQPECRYFMKTGSCKYGSDCKYHHPREKAAQLPTSSLGPLGLPLRPGQAVCSYYSMHGLCKYGPICKFDHPFVGYPYNYTLGLPTLSIPDPSVFPYQRYSRTVHSSETSPLKSSKFPDWARKLEAANKKNQNTDAKTRE